MLAIFFQAKNLSEVLIPKFSSIFMTYIDFWEAEDIFF
jgi:hypothetical protein